MYGLIYTLHQYLHTELKTSSHGLYLKRFCVFDRVYGKPSTHKTDTFAVQCQVLSRKINYIKINTLKLAVNSFL